jgi:hypothetical protein
MKCPYNQKVICGFLDPENNTENAVLHYCSECDHNPEINSAPKEDDSIPLIAGAPAVGCLFLAAAIIVGVLFALSELIIWIRS